MYAVRWTDLPRHLGAALLAPMALVALTGVGVFLQYGTGPDGLPRYAGAGRAGPEFLRTLHLWSSRVLIGATLAHAARVWYDGLTAPRQRNTHLVGSVSLLGLLLLHGSGHILRWDEAGRYLSAALGRPDAPGAAMLPLHAGLLPILLGLLVSLHFATVRAGTLVRSQPSAPPIGRRAAVLVASGIALGTVLTTALFPLRDARGPPWPFAPFDWIARTTGEPLALPLSVFAAWGLVAVQPYLYGHPWPTWTTRGLLVVTAAASIAMPPP